MQRWRRFSALLAVKSQHFSLGMRNSSSNSGGKCSTVDYMPLGFRRRRRTKENRPHTVVEGKIDHGVASGLHYTNYFSPKSQLKEALQLRLYERRGGKTESFLHVANTPAFTI